MHLKKIYIQDTVVTTEVQESFALRKEEPSSIVGGDSVLVEPSSNVGECSVLEEFRCQSAEIHLKKIYIQDTVMTTEVQESFALREEDPSSIVGGGSVLVDPSSIVGGGSLLEDLKSNRLEIDSLLNLPTLPPAPAPESRGTLPTASPLGVKMLDMSNLKKIADDLPCAVDRITSTLKKEGCYFEFTSFNCTWKCMYWKDYDYRLFNIILYNLPPTEENSRLGAKYMLVVNKTPDPDSDRNTQFINVPKFCEFEDLIISSCMHGSEDSVLSRSEDSVLSRSEDSVSARSEDLVLSRSEDSVSARLGDLFLVKDIDEVVPSVHLNKVSLIEVLERWTSKCIDEYITSNLINKIIDSLRLACRIYEDVVLPDSAGRFMQPCEIDIRCIEKLIQITCDSSSPSNMYLQYPVLILSSMSRNEGFCECILSRTFLQSIEGNAQDIVPVILFFASDERSDYKSMHMHRASVQLMRNFLRYNKDEVMLRIGTVEGVRAEDVIEKWMNTDFVIKTLDSIDNPEP